MAARFLGLLAAYLATHAVLRILVSPVVTIDDAREAVLAQTLEWGYQPRQPPLYNWLVWGAFRVLGAGVPSLTLVKYAVLGLAYGFVYASARRVLADPRLAPLAVFGLLLVVPLSWVLHEALTHSVAVLAACAATFHVLLRLEARGRLGDYVLFGLALGLGLLSKFTYAVFAVALLAAALTVDRFRTRLLDPRVLLALGVAVTLTLPYALWFAGHGFVFLGMASAEVHAGTQATYLAGVATGLYYVARITLYYVAPLGLVFLALFPGVYLAPPLGREGASPAGRLLERFFLCVLALLAAGVLTVTLEYLKFRWMIPAFFLVPLYAFWRLERTGYDARRLRRFVGVLVAAETVVVLGILVVIGSGSLGGRPYVLNEPYDVLADRLGGAGFQRGTIVVGLGPLAGSLRFRFPDSRVLSLEHPYYVPPRAGEGQCLVVWEKGDGRVVPPSLAAFLATALDVSLTGAEPIRAAEASYRHAPAHTRRVHYLLLAQGAGRCR